MYSNKTTSSTFHKVTVSREFVYSDTAGKERFCPEWKRKDVSMLLKFFFLNWITFIKRPEYINFACGMWQSE